MQSKATSLYNSRRVRLPHTARQDDIEITYFGRPFRGGPGVAGPPKAKALGLQFGDFEVDFAA